MPAIRVTFNSSGSLTLSNLFVPRTLARTGGSRLADRATSQRSPSGQEEGSRGTATPHLTQALRHGRTHCNVPRPWEETRSGPSASARAPGALPRELYNALMKQRSGTASQAVPLELSLSVQEMAGVEREDVPGESVRQNTEGRADGESAAATGC